MPLKHLLLVHSRPTGCDAATFEKWYLGEHQPDILDNKIASRAALYRESYDVPSLYAANKYKVHPRNYLAIYQTEHEEPLKSEGIKTMITTSDLFPNSKAVFDNGEFDSRNYNLISEFDPKGLGDSAPAPFILYAQLEHADGEEIAKFYKDEHFPLLGKVPGYRRGLRYTLGAPTGRKIDEPARFLALHELELEHGLEGSEEMKAVTETPWTMKVMTEVTFAEFRTFELIGSVGY